MARHEMKTLEISNEEYEIFDEKARPVENVAKMKVMDNLVAGNIIKTIGYYSANDGGGATYLIREKTATDVEDLGSIHFINDSLVAEMIINGCINVNQFGAIGDGVTDDTDKLQTAINYACTNKLKLIANPNKIYIINKPLYITQQYLNFDFNMATIKLSDNFSTNYNEAIYIDIVEDPHHDEQRIMRLFNKLTIDGNFKNINRLVYVSHMPRTFFNKINIINCYNTGFYIQRAYELFFNEIFMIAYDENEGINGIGTRIAFDVYTDDCSFTKITAIDFKTFAKLNDTNNTWTNIHVWIDSVSVLAGSTCFVAHGGTSLINDFYADTYETVFASETRYANFKINNLKTFFNYGHFDSLPELDMCIFRQLNELDYFGYWYGTSIKNSFLRSCDNETYHYKLFNGNHVPIIHYDNTNTFHNIKMDNYTVDYVRDLPTNVTNRYNAIICNEQMTNLNFLVDINVSELTANQFFTIGKLTNYKLSPKNTVNTVGQCYSYSNKNTHCGNLQITSIDPGNNSGGEIKLYVTPAMIDDNVTQLYINVDFQNRNSTY